MHFNVPAASSVMVGAVAIMLARSITICVSGTGDIQPRKRGAIAVPD